MKYEPQARYDALHTTRLTIKLNLRTDADIIDQLDRADSKAGLIKRALRAYRDKPEQDKRQG